MCFRSVTKTIAVTVLAAATLGACSEYLDRRDTVTLYSGEAMAANRVTQTIDPWSAASANRNIAYNGEKAADAAERYRTGKVIKPVSPLTNTAYGQQQQQSSQSSNSGSGSSSSGAGNGGGSNN